MCKEKDCEKRPNFNFEGEKTALYCATHKKEGMINVKDKTCLDCKKRPNFNFEGEKTALYCATHKKEGMINVISKTCLDCEKIPNFNFEGEKTALYCATHKKEGMINVKDKTCLDCEKQPVFNFEGEKTRLYCAIHKKEGMIDIKNKTCLDCKKQPVFNFEGEKTGLYCATHKKEGMINVKDKTCKSEWCFTLVGHKYNGYCLFCYTNLFPDKPITRNYKTKEYAVVEYVKNEFGDYIWKADKKIDGGCSKRRPDLLLDLGYQIIIVEIDENQHIDYDCSCENKRIMELSQDLGYIPIVFIRFNPDDYKIDGKVISSCWTYNKKGLCVIKKSKENEWLQRLKVLEEQINYWIKFENKTIEIIELFYDK